MMSIHEIHPDGLRRYIRTHHEQKYLLVDVRQPAEYQEGHIPGARLLPLPELAKIMDTLPKDKELVFYCHSGARSMAASIMVEEEFPQGEIYNLTGGMLSWNGAVTEKPPRVQLFDMQASAEQMLMTAMNLERGAMNFYMTVDERYGGEDWSDVFGKLAEAEIGHALMVYRLWQRNKTGVDDFDTIFGGLSGAVLEGGLTLIDVLDRAASIGGSVCIRLMELALNVEYSAFDLYRTMADQALDEDARKAFLSIAQAEKSHMNILVDALGSCPT
jgi:sulfur-carrier protein adenylyltransferase/sulfurtransferase